MGVMLRAHDGAALSIDPDRWHRDATKSELSLLQGSPGPVLDVGCGPGRFVVGLARLGVMTLGVDPSPRAIALARQRGATVLQRSVFDRLPGEGRWRTVLLMDGNIGIGGDPLRLLRRCRQLAAPEGRLIVEVDPPGTGRQIHCARLEQGGLRGPWFRWAVVGTDAIASLAMRAGLSIQEIGCFDGRWFAHLEMAASASVVA